ncbi:glycosyltransferase family 4 protein [Marinobacter fonticola]|uniref:glycosyltransferase family 4 protein n=1 Tax=Marinobacter fonticola TaxID=2603215 RepID=UPI0011E6BEE8|nr:glycosyltransferase family 4 protein [Marinobacter fonticola]
MRSDQPQTVFLVPGDPNQRTGGYGYVRSIVGSLRERGQNVRLSGLEGAFPETDTLAQQSLDDALDELADRTTVIIDGLALSGLPPLQARHTTRLRVLALVHHPLADETGLSQERQRAYFASEKAALRHVKGVIVTSEFTARRLIDFDVEPARIEVVTPGVDKPDSIGPDRFRTPEQPFRLLCVATLAPRKGQDLLVEALAQCRDYPWHCSLAGSTERHPDFVASLRKQIEQLGLAERIDICGELGEQALAQAYRGADVFILPSWYEGYGMVVTEALAYGLPVITTTGGALAFTAASEASIKVPPGDVTALRAALTQVLSEPERHRQLVAGAGRARNNLRSWSDAGEAFADAIQKLLN